VHIADGYIESASVLAGGALLAAAGVTIGLRKTNYDRLPQVAVLTATFFVASLIRVPVGAASAHLLLVGLVGLILGWAAFPALFVALLLQAVFFGHGGLTTLGVNTLDMALPAVACHYLFRRALRRNSGARSRRSVFRIGFAAGLAGFALAGGMTASVLLISGNGFESFVGVMGIAHLPLLIVEALVTGSVVVFLRRVCPELLAQPGSPRIESSTTHV
jgi:cobalt/nickel transport system permease protein